MMLRTKRSSTTQQLDQPLKKTKTKASFTTRLLKTKYDTAGFHDLVTGV
jgi:hypothetical protein